MSTLEDKTIKELVIIHDALQGVESIGTWKGRKDLLIKKVGAALKTARGNRTIREVAEALLIETVETLDGKPTGHPYNYVLEQVLEEFPEANTTVKCLRWYNTKLNSNPDVKMPVRPRKKAVKAEVPTAEVPKTAEPTRDLVDADPLA